MNDKEKYGYIYLTTNLINNKKYIGQHKNKYFNPKYKGSGKLIIEAFKKYGKENFNTEILEWCFSKEEMDEKEKYYIIQYDAVKNPNFYNISEGGEGHCCEAWSKGLNKENNSSLLEISNKMKFQATTNAKLQEAYHLPASQLQKESVKKARLGVKDSQETLEKKRVKRGKYNYTEESRNEKAKRWSGENNPNYGGRTPEARKKESESMSNRKHIHKIINGIIINKLVKEDQIQNYLNDGWEFGWIYNK